MKHDAIFFNIVLSIFLLIQLSFTQNTQPTVSTESTITIIKTPAQLQREERIKNDWPNLARFRDENAKLGLPVAKENRVVLFGDSITEQWSIVYPQFLEGKPYVNRGISGQTTPQMVIRFRQDVIALKPRVVVILGGTNDIAGNTGPSTLEMIEDNIMSMSELAQANKIKVVLAAVLPVYDYPWKKGLNPAEKIGILNEWIKQYCQKKGFVYLDYYTPLVDERKGLKSELTRDGVHPNVAGYKVMAPLTDKAIMKALHQR
ncbi:MAG: SGNH/GDSL hydrolase family protein [bacterium]